MKKLSMIFIVICILCSSININAESIFTINKTENSAEINDNINLEEPPIPNPLYIKESYLVPMRDGINLATDVYLPSEEMSPHGCILIRTPYNKNGQNMGSWADAGWPTIVQDMRGRYASEGVDTVFRNAHTDGPDTLEWISEQEWCNNKIATYGGSALGINQYYMAGANPPFLACQYIQVATPNLYKHAMFQGGEFRKYMVEEWLRGQGSLFVLPELIEHENYTLDYWTNTSLDDNWQDVNVPAIHIGGWYDCFAQGIIDGFMGYQYLGGRGARGLSKLIMGPWTHGFGLKQGELTYPENAEPDFPFEMFVDMINQYTMGENFNFDNWPAVSYYVMGDVDTIDAPGNEWRFADVWPIPAYDTEWYLHIDGSLSRDIIDSEFAAFFSYNPTDPVPTLGGQNLVLAKGPYDQTPIESRDDVLIFTSQVFDEPYEATGPIKARLYVSSNCPDTDFTVKLSDVYPDGRSMLITDGILRMRNRNGFDHWEFIEPGEVYEIEVDLWSSSYIWNEGHSIRVAVSSSNYPRFLNNPNTADAIYDNTTFNIANNIVYMSDEYPSCMILPEIPKANTNNPPFTPEVPVGPSSGRFWKELFYCSNAVDPEGDQVYLLFDWDDGSHSGWIGPYESGQVVNLSHSWRQGNYNIIVKSKDIYGSQSNWSEPLSITISKNKNAACDFVISFLEQIFNRFEFLQNIVKSIQDEYN